MELPARFKEHIDLFARELLNRNGELALKWSQFYYGIKIHLVAPIKILCSVNIFQFYELKNEMETGALQVNFLAFETPNLFWAELIHFYFNHVILFMCLQCFKIMLIENVKRGRKFFVTPPNIINLKPSFTTQQI